LANLNSVLGEEIRRLARKEVKAQADAGKDAAARQRTDIVALKKRVNELERRLTAVAKGGGKRAAAVASGDGAGDGAKRPRFSPAWVKKHREKLGLSAADYGKLAGVSGLTIY